MQTIRDSHSSNDYFLVYIRPISTICIYQKPKTDAPVAVHAALLGTKPRNGITQCRAPLYTPLKPIQSLVTGMSAKTNLCPRRRLSKGSACSVRDANIRCCIAR